MSENELSVDPSELHTAAARLDALAHRLESTMNTHAAGLKVPASGSDEVSVRAADTFNTVAEDFGTDGDNAAHELRKIAAVLRLQANTFGRAEDTNLTTFLA
ncbi:PE domain-containing protein [Gordonia sp. SID5947]|uniref:PE family protein n=1 Tax=Gordonia sp. SID5947 TaxID=2690315 RepID=UPI0013709A17|nr:PE family protein [Gordonia sp. SID5947]MYR07567.1 PE domain-containing protein [Gordonia sp. SID5947]